MPVRTTNDFTKIKTPSEIADMRVSGRILAGVLAAIRQYVQPGVTQKDVSALAARELKSLGGLPVFLNYQGYPDIICVSVNDAVVHGIPTNQAFKEGDVAGFDFGVSYNGMITDSAFSMVVGSANDQAKSRLVRVTEEALSAGIKTLRDKVRVGDIGATVSRVLDRHHYGIVRDLVGHGVGHRLHEDPDIPNYGMPGTGPILRAGMTVAIEPMASLGDGAVMIDQDGWTVRTADGSVSAHFEHTVLITETGAEVLTTL